MSDIVKNFKLDYAYDRWAEILEHKKLEDLLIPMSDEQAYLWDPQYRWMFNKLELCNIQKIKAFPHGIKPTKWDFPVFSKPIINLYGLSAETRTMYEWKDEYYRPGHMWMQKLDGEQWSVDLVLQEGKAVWAYAWSPQKDSRNSFVAWNTASEVDQVAFLIIAGAWCEEWFKGYTGPVNIEGIGASVIESVPRISTQFLDFYGEKWLDSVAKLVATRKWEDPGEYKTGSSFILRVPKSAGNLIPYVKDYDELMDIEKEYTLSVCLPWYRDQPFAKLTDDPNTYRLAIVNAEDTDKGLIGLRKVSDLIDYKIGE